MVGPPIDPNRLAQIMGRLGTNNQAAQREQVRQQQQMQNELAGIRRDRERLQNQQGRRARGPLSRRIGNRTNGFINWWKNLALNIGFSFTGILRFLIFLVLLICVLFGIFLAISYSTAYIGGSLSTTVQEQGWEGVKSQVSTFFSGIAEKLPIVGIVNETITSAWHKGTGEFYRGQVDKNAEEPLGVFIEDIKPAEKSYTTDDEVIVWAKLRAMTLDSPIEISVSCDAEGIPFDTLEPRSTFNVDIYEEEDLSCVFNKKKLEPGARKVTLRTQFNFETLSYLKTYFMDIETIRSMRRESLDINKRFGIPNKNPIATYSNGPLGIGIELKEAPIGINREAEEQLLPLGISLINNWKGKVTELTNMTLVLPQGLTLKRDTNEFTYCGKYHFQTCEDRPEETICEDETKNIYFFDQSYETSRVKSFDKLHFFTCRVAVDPDEETLLGNTPLSTKYIEVTAEYIYQNAQSTTVQIKKGLGSDNEIITHSCPSTLERKEDLGFPEGFYNTEEGTLKYPSIENVGTPNDANYKYKTGDTGLIIPAGPEGHASAANKASDAIEEFAKENSYIPNVDLPKINSPLMSRYIKFQEYISTHASKQAPDGIYKVEMQAMMATMLMIATNIGDVENHPLYDKDNDGFPDYVARCWEHKDPSGFYKDQIESEISCLAQTLRLYLQELTIYDHHERLEYGMINYLVKQKIRADETNVDDGNIEKNLMDIYYQWLNALCTPDKEELTRGDFDFKKQMDIKVKTVGETITAYLFWETNYPATFTVSYKQVGKVFHGPFTVIHEEETETQKTKEESNENTTKQKASTKGTYTIEGLPPGDYEFHVTAKDSLTETEKKKARTVTLELEEVGEAEIKDDPIILRDGEICNQDNECGPDSKCLQSLGSTGLINSKVCCDVVGTPQCPDQITNDKYQCTSTNQLRNEVTYSCTSTGWEKTNNPITNN